jgi:hypothetical protein
MRNEWLARSFVIPRLPAVAQTVSVPDIGVYPDCNDCRFPAFMPRPKRIE